MSKLNYPPQGLHVYCRMDIENTLKNLSSAISKCHFDIPGDFSYRNYLWGLSGVLSGCRNGINSVNSEIIGVDKDFQDLSDNLSLRASRIESTRINHRDRMIV